MAETKDVPIAERLERSAAEAGERLVGSGGFAVLLGQLTENTAALTRLGTDTFDLVLRNLRIAGRGDITRLSQQLGRTEDKLERVLQEVEALRDAAEASRPGAAKSANGGSASTRKRAARK